MDKRNTLTISVGRLLVGGMLFSASVAQAASGSGASTSVDADANALTILQREGRSITGTVTDQ